MSSSSSVVVGVLIVVVNNASMIFDVVLSTEFDSFLSTDNSAGDGSGNLTSGGDSATPKSQVKLN